MKKMVLYILGIILVLPVSFSLDNGLALTPPMGWMSWERFRCNINCDMFPKDCISENLIKRTADAMASEGYAALGYKYIVLDDCWLSDKRDDRGNLQPNMTRFPSGILGLSRYVHSKGLLFGLYEDFGTKTCAGYPGVIFNMEADVNMFAQWEVDYVKLDGCNSDPKTMDIGYPEFQKYLNKTQRPMVFSCSWPTYQEEIGIKPNFTKISQYCNLWRNYDDVQDSWESVKTVITYFAKHQDVIAPYAGPGHWNDPDMLVIGNYGLSLDQSKVQMAVWCILSAPLMMSVDLATIRPEFKEILQNKQAIKVNQDPLGIQGRLVLTNHRIQIWRKPTIPVHNGYYSYAIAFVSMREDGSPSVVSLMFADIGLYNPGGYSVQDIFEGTYYSEIYSACSNLTVRVNPSGVVFLQMKVHTSNDSSFITPRKTTSLEVITV